MIYKVFYIQCSILRQALGLPLISPPQQPRRHPFPTFEFQLPLTFCKSARPRLDPINLVSVAASQDISSRPELLCHFCKTEIRLFFAITNLWAHIIYYHEDLEEEARLQEIRRVGIVWRAYWILYTYSGKNDPTRLKLEQVLKDDFDWQCILQWRLRK
jgi:hypothetical protein